MRRKKQGASLIVLVIIFMFVFTVSTAMLSMVASNYKARVTESKRIENLYASDSGLNVAYNIIGKTFDAATKYAYYEVEALKSTDGNAKSPNDYKYKAVNAEIDALTLDIEGNDDHDDTLYGKGNETVEGLEDEIDDLKKETPTTTRTRSDINKDIEDKKIEIAQKKSLIEEDENLKKLLLDEEFKRTFKNFIAETSDKGTNESLPHELQESIEKNEYVSEDNFVNKEKTINFDGKTADFDKETINFEIQNKNGNPPTLDTEIEDDFGSAETVTIKSGNSITLGDIQISAGHSDALENLQITKSADHDSYKIGVISTFDTESYIKNGEEKTVNRRQLKATYKMTVPNYKDIYFQNSNESLNDLATKDRALTIYGDMKVHDVNRLTVDAVDGVDGGEIFVEGSPDTDKISTDRVYGKYFGGITVTNSDGVKFKENVITRGTFNVQTPATVEDTNTRTTSIEKSLYAKNIYVGNIDGTELPNQKSQLTIKDAIINNDLTLNSNNAKITVNNLYGINDINPENKVESSSSIIVNGNSDSTIKIEDSAYLMGTAHIAMTNEANDYQTAESGAVKGNYIAYAVPVPLDNTTEKFAYYDPLQLLEPSLYTTQSALEVKKQHFIDYWSQEGKNANPGGIQWPNKENIYSVGVIVYETTDENGVTKSEVVRGKSTGDSEISGVVNSKRAEFAKYDYKFGQDNLNLLDDYNNSNIMSFDSLIDTSKLPTKYNLNDGEYAIFNGTVDGKIKKIKITKSSDSDTSIDSDTDSNVINIQVGNNGELNAIIATAGDVFIESGVTINGCIIAKGDLDITGSDIKIKYDPDVIERVQAQNFDTFKYIFGGDADSTSPSDGSMGTNGSANYDLKNFLESKLWKIIN